MGAVAHAVNDRISSTIEISPEGDMMFFMVRSVVRLSCHCLRHRVTAPAEETFLRYAFSGFVIWEAEECRLWANPSG